MGFFSFLPGARASPARCNSNRQLAVPVNNSKKKKKKKEEETRNKKTNPPTRNLKNLCSEAFNDCKVAPFLQAGRQGGREGGETARSTQRPAEVRAQFTARFTSLLTLHKLAFLIRETGGTAGQCMPASQGGAIAARIVVKPLKNLHQ